MNPARPAHHIGTKESFKRRPLGFELWQLKLTHYPARGRVDMLHRNNLPTAVPHPQKGQCGALIGLHQPRCHVGHAGGFNPTIRTTPAMAAGVTKRLWEMTDIVDMLEAWEAAE